MNAECAMRTHGHVNLDSHFVSRNFLILFYYYFFSSYFSKKSVAHRTELCVSSKLKWKKKCHENMCARSHWWPIYKNADAKTTVRSGENQRHCSGAATAHTGVSIMIIGRHAEWFVHFVNVGTLLKLQPTTTTATIIIIIVLRTHFCV